MPNPFVKDKSLKLDPFFYEEDPKRWLPEVYAASHGGNTSGYLEGLRVMLTRRHFPLRSSVRILLQYCESDRGKEQLELLGSFSTFEVVSSHLVVNAGIRLGSQLKYKMHSSTSHSANMQVLLGHQTDRSRMTRMCKSWVKVHIHRRQKIHLNNTHIGFSEQEIKAITADVVDLFYSQDMRDSDLQRAKEATLLWTSWVQKLKGLLMDEKALAIKERRDAVEAVDTKPVVKAIMLSYAECDEKQILPAFFFALHVFRQYNYWGHLLSESDCLMSAVGPILNEFMAVQHEIKFTSANACTRVGKARKMHLQQSGQSRQPDVIGLTASNEEVFYGELKGPTPKAAAVNTDVLRLAVFSKDSLDQAHKVLAQGLPLLTFQTVGRDVTFFLAAKISNTIVHTRLSSVRLPAFLSEVDVDLDVFFHLFQVQSLVHVTRDRLEKRRAVPVQDAVFPTLGTPERNAALKSPTVSRK
ncbi:hypothetical protein EC957_009586 [Mortierella hygrophila]|uniref:Uncharacterized protein n=1 Tax=Mortierella hygrophila TaxID=979708 RepID=A0A9P6JXR2_9FUNG|nr:hypothetical protein EC957_009586 [Mortierella hygrophila]